MAINFFHILNTMAQQILFLIKVQEENQTDITFALVQHHRDNIIALLLFCREKCQKSFLKFNQFLMLRLHL